MPISKILPIPIKFPLKIQSILKILAISNSFSFENPADLENPANLYSFSFGNLANLENPAAGPKSDTMHWHTGTRYEASLEGFVFFEQQTTQIVQHCSNADYQICANEQAQRLY